MSEIETSSQTKVRARANKKMREKGEQIKDHKMKSLMRFASDQEIKLTNPTEFFEKMSRPTQSRLYTFCEEVRNSTEEMLDQTGVSKIIEINDNGQWRWRQITSSKELKEILANDKKALDRYLKIRENAYSTMFKKNKEYGFNINDNSAGNQSPGALEVRNEYTPLIGTPFFKQLYLYDYWEMHSKCFWYKNYSGIAKLIVEMTRNFVLGKGFSVSFDDDKCQDAWSAYEERSNIQEEIRNWCDELTAFGENMIKKIPTSKGIIHKSFDPSTIWEIITDPENISDIKYYHQQYNTQYQLYGTKDTPLSKYVLNQIPPQLVHHTKVNVTSYEKRGRSDLLSALLYFKYYEDYCQARLSRAKAEACYIWDVSIDGSEEDVQAYINLTQSASSVPPGSENVHNKAITRTAITPSFTKAGGDQIAQDILSYIAMSVSIPASYMGTFNNMSNTKAGALVATEPVAKKFAERQLKLETLIRKIVKDVLMDAGLDPKTPFEVNFPELFEEDRSAKIQDLILSKDEQVISHQRMSEMIAKEMKITKYDYQDEQDVIDKEKAHGQMFGQDPTVDPADPALTVPKIPVDPKDNRSVDRQAIRKNGKSYGS